MGLYKARSRAVSTERTILSPFTKEYRVLAAYSGIRLFLEGFLFEELLSMEVLNSSFIYMMFIYLDQNVYFSMIILVLLSSGFCF